ncbi:MAG: UTP--glucose-1-phosphate uridylyltransferase GalU [Nitrospinae bacterium]|nr:UTP--glucose-1-phosphate uridylyltransferase GalU [Nitrospinota bacterium]
MKKVKKAVFPVAGMGTRFLPATKASPKEMLPLVDKPLIQYVVEEAIESGIQEIIMITGRGKNAIEDHFDRSMELENLLEKRNQTEELASVRKISDMCDFWYIRQKEPMGLGHAILKARDMIGDEPFAVLLGDDIIHTNGTPALAQLLEVYNRTGASVVAIEEVAKERVSSYGIVDPVHCEGSLCMVKGLVEKPEPESAPSNLAVIGRYVLTPRIFEMLDKVNPDQKGEIQLTAGLNALCAVEPLHGCKFTGKRYDAGDKLGFVIATVEYALRRGDIGTEFQKYLAELKF